MKKLYLILGLAAILAVYACGSKNNYEGTSATDYSPNESHALSEDPMPTPQNVDQKLESTIERKVIKEGNLSFETKDLKTTHALISKTVKELNGYIAQDNEYGYDTRYEHRLIIRVDATKFDILLDKISASAVSIDSKDITVKDVTEEYIDVESRIKTQKELQERYKELLKKATGIDEMLQLTREIGNLQTEIEAMEGKMRYLKDRIAYSTLTVTYYQKSASSFGFISKLGTAFKDGWEGFLWFLIGISRLWVFVIILIPIIYLLIHRRKKKLAQKKLRQ